MNSFLSRLPQGRWVRTLVLAVLGLFILWLMAWLGVPPLLKWQLQCQLLQEAPVHQPHSSSSTAGQPALPAA